MSVNVTVQITGRFEDKYIAFLDVLGFSNLILQGPDGFSKLFDTYVRTLNRAINSVDKAIEFSIFSDTIVITSTEKSFESFLNLSEVVSIVCFEFLLEAELPIKGAISYGKVSTLYSHEDSRHSVIVGEPIIEAYRFEQQLDWIGVMICPSVVKQNAEHFEPYQEVVYDKKTNKYDILEYTPISGWIEKFKPYITNYDEIPLKNENGYYSGYAIVPIGKRANFGRWSIDNLQAYIGNLKRLKQFAPNVNVQKKYDSTIRFAENQIVRIECLMNSGYLANSSLKSPP